MTRQEVAQMINEMGLPYAYYQFPHGTEQAPPFVCFFYSQSDDVYADDTNYRKIAQLNIELYTREKDFNKESTLEEILNNHGLTYHKYESYIDSERMWQVAYETQVFIDEPNN